MRISYGGAAAIGLGIWSMHYIGMLAYNLPVDALYNQGPDARPSRSKTFSPASGIIAIGPPPSAASLSFLWRFRLSHTTGPPNADD
jgi:hypothetical protein